MRKIKLEETTTVEPFVLSQEQAKDNRGRDLPKGIRQRKNGTYEGRIAYEGKRYNLYGDTITEAKKGFFEDIPKTNSSKRDIPLTDDILQIMDEQKYFWGKTKVFDRERYLFCNEDGSPISRERVQREIERIIKNINEDGVYFEHITMHCFRHTFATRAIEARMQPQTLKTILGHSTLAMTIDLYSHVLPTTKAQEMKMITNVFNVS